jgi:hypothetical protein
MTIPVAARSKMQVCFRPLAAFPYSNPAGGMGYLFLQLFSVVYYQVVVSVTGRSLFQGNSTVRLCVIEYD